MISRRSFLILAGSSLFARPSRGNAMDACSGAATGPGKGSVVHPEPRPGITGAKVLTADRLHDMPDLIPLFDGIRQYPQMADGIRCSCGCATMPNYRSLLSCYEDPGMARMCEICQGQGELVVRRAKEGQTLAQIRTAIDARFNAGKS